MASAVLTPRTVELGFLELCEPWLLTNTFFPSKVGGRPAWLELENVPSLELLKCRKCQEILVFLCQVYATQEETNCFHRTIFVFICKNPSCWQINCSKNIVAFRSQLPRENRFYNYEPPNDQEQLAEIKSPVRLCEVCGIRGPFSCSNCKEVSYCSSGHQKIDWLNGHKNKCKNSVTQPPNEHHTFLLPEYELNIEPEEDDDTKTKESDAEAEARRQVTGKELENNAAADGTASLDESELLPYASADQDVMFGRFKNRIADNNDQVLRYDRGGEPLWISSKGILSEDKVPNCELCNARRVLEFQIMPQLLNSLKDPHIDWGVINVYTCEKSCELNSTYCKEFVYKQDAT